MFIPGTLLHAFAGLDAPSVTGWDAGCSLGVRVDKDARTLAFRVNRGEWTALPGVTAPAVVRPWAALCHPGDALSLAALGPPPAPSSGPVSNARDEAAAADLPPMHPPAARPFGELGARWAPNDGVALSGIGATATHTGAVRQWEAGAAVDLHRMWADRGSNARPSPSTAHLAACRA